MEHSGETRRGLQGCCRLCCCSNCCTDPVSLEFIPCCSGGKCVCVCVVCNVCEYVACV